MRSNLPLLRSETAFINYFSFCRVAERSHTSKKKLKMKTATVRLPKLQHTRFRYTLVYARSNLKESRIIFHAQELKS